MFRIGNIVAIGKLPHARYGTKSVRSPSSLRAAGISLRAAGISLRAAGISLRAAMRTLALVSFVVSVSGCNDDDVGVRCTTTSSSAADPESVGSGFVLAQALECESRICILSESSQSPVPRCTKACAEDGDCPETGPNCTEGYVCRVGSVVNVIGLRCCKLCICKDDLSQAARESDPKEEACIRAGIQNPSCPAF